ncbi:ATP phosphoribosyltransferase regulatory subunit [Lentibacillus sp. N15]|uniref:ATP phosphoribosyltransferase regulatory subunit n=1 Tax=Lentibacillus songyuanensis TaxID=3136161 RepID=UPI0031BBABF6
MLQFHNQNTLRQDDYQKQEYVLEKMKKRFATYGYQQIQTPTFENYDLYQSITGTIHTEEMIKVIAPSGKVLVLRPDVTIPITRRLAAGTQLKPEEERFFYTSNVFRNDGLVQERNEQMQAGIENFGNGSAELDAEVITLAIHTLQDLGFDHFKLVIGHAGFFKELLDQTSLSDQETVQLQAMIQAKNFSEIEAFLDPLAIDAQSKHSLLQIPLLYGTPQTVIDRAASVALNAQMQEKVQSMLHLLEVLTVYGVEQFITFDLGLINHMDYYSDIIFQGFVENFGKPVLMGGRYNHLAEQFNRPMPAIGFAFDTDSIMDVMEQEALFPNKGSTIDIYIFYARQKLQEALTAAQMLRSHGLHVRTETAEHHQKPSADTTIIYYEETGNLVSSNGSVAAFTKQAELVDLLKEDD